MTSTIAQRRGALFSLFFLAGLALSSWVTRTPAIRDLLDASTGEMGLVLLGLSAGSMVGILSSGPLCIRFGARPVITVGNIGIVASMPTIGLGAAAGSAGLVVAGLFLFGAGSGGADVAMNVEGADVEKIIQRPFLPLLHGGFSLGTVVGAVAGILAIAAGLPVTWHLIAVGAVGLVLFLWAIRHLPPATGRAEPGDRPTAGADKSGLWRDPRLLLTGLVVLAMALAEGAANDWLPLVMVDGHGLDPALGSVVYAVFAASMTLGRFAGGPVIARLGRAQALAASAVLGGVGVLLVSVVDNVVVASAAVVLWGLGAALGFPVALSLAGDSGPNPAARVALASTIGYLAFLVGPPLLGLVGDEVGLRSALLIPMGMLLVGAVVATLLGRRTPGRG
ncbi:MFS transporter [Propionibacteriaceae bacterium Y1923]